jgi:hypothetical protein
MDVEGAAEGEAVGHPPKASGLLVKVWDGMFMAGRLTTQLSRGLAANA